MLVETIDGTSLLLWWMPVCLHFWRNFRLHVCWMSFGTRMIKNGYINFLISFNMYCRCSDQLELNMYKNVLHRWIYDIYKNVICFCISYMHIYIYIIIYTTYLRFFRSCFSGYCWFYTSIPTYLCFHKNRGNTDPDPSGSATATPGWGDGSVWLVEFR